jgi:beta-phosphoglucomutase family hydrolase
MLSAIIFDMDGVVIDSHPVHKKSWSLFLQSVGREVSEEELEFVVEGTKREDILRHFLGDLDPDQLHEYGLRKEALFRQQAISIQPIPGVKTFIQDAAANGLLVALASSGSKTRVHYILDHLCVKEKFGVIVTGDDVKNGKPDPSVFRLAAERLGVAASEALVFEDAIAGVQAAKSAGMKCIGVAQGSRTQLLKDAGADHVIPDFQRLSAADFQSFV